MDRDRVKGVATQAKGSVKQAVGRVSGHARMHAEGKADTGVGKAQVTAGTVKNAVRDTAKK